MDKFRTGPLHPLATEPLKNGNEEDPTRSGSQRVRKSRKNFHQLPIDRMVLIYRLIPQEYIFVKCIPEG